MAAHLIFGGRFRAIEEIGSGSLGKVYFCWDEQEKRNAVVKYLAPSPPGFSHMEWQARFDREARLLMALQPASGTLSLIARGDDFFATEWVAAMSLDQHIVKNGPITGDRLDRLAVRLFDVISEIHGLGVAHKDLKPSNVLLCLDDSVRLIDFDASSRDSAGTETVRAGEWVTWEFSSPWRIRADSDDFLSSEDAKASDWFSYAATIVFAGTGVPPFGAAPLCIDRILNGSPELGAIAEPLKAALEEGLTPIAANDTEERLRRSLDPIRPQRATIVGSHPTVPSGEEPQDRTAAKPTHPLRQGEQVEQQVGVAAEGSRWTASRMSRRRSVWIGSALVVLAVAIVVGMNYLAGIGQGRERSVQEKPELLAPSTTPHLDVSERESLSLMTDDASGTSTSVVVTTTQAPAPTTAPPVAATVPSNLTPYCGDYGKAGTGQDSASGDLDGDGAVDEVVAVHCESFGTMYPIVVVVALSTGTTVGLDPYTGTPIDLTTIRTRGAAAYDHFEAVEIEGGTLDVRFMETDIGEGDCCPSVAVLEQWSLTDMNRTKVQRVSGFDAIKYMWSGCEGCDVETAQKVRELRDDYGYATAVSPQDCFPGGSLSTLMAETFWVRPELASIPDFPIDRTCFLVAKTGDAVEVGLDYTGDGRWQILSLGAWLE